MATATKTRKTSRKPETAAEREAREAARAEKLAGVQRALEEGVQQLASSAEWKRMLKTAAKFHTYSWRNCMLIAMQCPHATHVAGYRAWQSMDRQVRKGEPGIKITAPNTYRVKEDGAPEDDKGQVQVRGFRVEHVWDISQTDGEPLPDVAPSVLDGEAPAGLWDALVAQAEAAGYTVAREATVTGAEAEVEHTERIVRVQPEAGDAAATRALAHEVAHILLGHQGGKCGNPREQREVEAESVAFAVCSAVGFDTGSTSFAYIAGWAEEGKEVEAVTATADRVVKTARGIIDALPDGLAA